MMDARSFEAAFPALPLVGYYADGEIGPQALAEMERPWHQPGRVALQVSPWRRQQAGFTLPSAWCGPFTEHLSDSPSPLRMARSQMPVQGFTAVFGMFVVPDRIKPDTWEYSAAQLRNYMRQRWRFSVSAGPCELATLP